MENTAFALLAMIFAIALTAWLALRGSRYQYLATVLFFLGGAGWLIVTFGFGLISGEVQSLARRGYVLVYRDAQPAEYWTSIVLRACIGLVMLYAALWAYRKRPNNTPHTDAKLPPC